MVELPNGKHIYPRETIELAPSVRLHVSRWAAHLETPQGWYVLSADAHYRAEADGLWFGTLSEAEAGLG